MNQPGLSALERQLICDLLAASKHLELASLIFTSLNHSAADQFAVYAEECFDEVQDVLGHPFGWETDTQAVIREFIDESVAYETPCNPRQT